MKDLNFHDFYCIAAQNPLKYSKPELSGSPWFSLIQESFVMYPLHH